MKFRSKIIRDWPLRRKLFFTSFSMCFLAVVLLSVYMWSQIKQIIMDNTVFVYQHSTEQIALDVARLFDGCYTSIDQLLQDEKIIDFVEMEYTSDQQQYRALSDYVLEQMKKSDLRNTYDTKLYLLHQNPTIDMSAYFTSQPSGIGLSAQRLEDMMSCAYAKPSFGGVTELASREYLVMFGAIRKSFNTSAPPALVIQYIPLSRLESLLSQNGHVSDMVSLYDPEGNLVLSVNEEAQQSLQEYTVSAELPVGSSAISHWEVQYSLPVSAINNARNKMTSSIVAVAAVLLLATFLVSWYYSKTLAARLHILVEHMHKLEDGDVSDRIDICDQDEVGQLYQSYNIAVSRLQRLMEEKYISELQLERSKNALLQANYRALQYQINPHYLFNTLESIRMKLISLNQREIAQIIHAFSDSFRTILENDQEMITLQQELDFLDRYMVIQQFRFNNQIDFRKELVGVQPDTDLLPSMILQPLVENSLHHGFQYENSPFRILIKVTAENNRISIDVQDNGCGISPEELEQIRTEIKAQTQKNRYLALKNIYGRLHLRYGDEAKLDLHSSEQGTLVHLEYPREELQRHV